ncbi:type 1 glutamine amidotransferase domain-containing protein [Pelomicrobium methylotrophicum]|uniref:Type 1 glutamine amidotransferase n=1 Tax=Pelomicrobium methylotrophicum TaxID=2602750 RepID=A0A5C7ESQ6_9PROT|nr:type 1 glutamine amidotransferase domain-containing protein [Pelomicrobium methylotrophicum]TXF10036.1 type 1 glutamine amidotransferase [Pelomicrobium methylotrophicum]
MRDLGGRHVAVLVENNYQEMEVWYPIYRFLEGGAKVSIVGPKAEKYTSKLGYPVIADMAAADALKMYFDAVIIPGGYAPDLMRLNDDLITLVRNHALAGKVVAAICHGSWMLASAGVIRGKRLTGAPQIRDDLRNAGATYLDEEAVRDGNIITSRKPDDIPAFCAAIIAALTEARVEAA